MERELLTIKENQFKIIQLLSEQKTVLQLDDAASYIGFSKSYLYKLTSSNAIPHYKPQGKQIYFDKNELDQWLLRNRVKTVDEVEKEATDHLLNKKR